MSQRTIIKVPPVVTKSTKATEFTSARYPEKPRLEPI